MSLDRLRSTNDLILYILKTPSCFFEVTQFPFRHCLLISKPSRAGAVSSLKRPLFQGAKRCPFRPVPANWWSLVDGNHQPYTWAQWHAWKNETRLGTDCCHLGWAEGPPFFVGVEGDHYFPGLPFCVFVFIEIGGG